ncbi:SAM-dependent methyltransferase [Nocardioides sp. R-C-SC26]|uniref:class I SAM-dependent methyltransferase n=1 Tax=Nocardioides sp. R-C-SC26 TaxID=2870414 RepID=UPI001E2FEF99|nr:SAM-dependent methyltransferase [Nocardioides sp. R-C-SC26]
MSEPLTEALARLRVLLLDPDGLVRAVASGVQKGRRPAWRRIEARYVDLKSGRHLQVTSYDATQAHTANHAVGEPAAVAVDALLAEPFGNWHVDTSTETHQLRVTKKLDAVTHTRRRDQPVVADRGHDRDKERLLPLDDPIFAALGLADEHGRIKPSRQAKVRQVEEFLRQLDAAVSDARAGGHLRRPTSEDPLRVVDLGCGNAYLTFAALRFLGEVRGLPVAVTGVDVKEQSRAHNTAVAERLGLQARFEVGTIADAVLDPAPEIVLALHACDTATDEALARAVEWDAALVLAAPCCHHDIAAQLRRNDTPSPYAALTRHGILRERFADTLTDGLRALLLRLHGYRVDVVEFIDSQHTPRNTLLRGVRTGTRGSVSAASAGGLAGVDREYDELVGTWHLRPRLAELLGR